MSDYKLHFVEKILTYKTKRVVGSAARQKFDFYKEGQPLRILIIGYSGKRNIGAEVRAAEIIKQIKSLDLGLNLHFGVLTLNPKESRPFFPNDVEMVPMKPVFFKTLLSACNAYHMGILAEGSCLTSVTSNVAALFFICAAGILKAQAKLCIGYGVEAGPLPKELIKFASHCCNETFYIARTSYAAKLFEKYGFKPLLGTDTAWSIQGIDLSWAKKELMHKYQWDGETPLIGISAINAFIRPIKPNLKKFLKGKLLNRWENHYDSIYFYTVDSDRLKKYHAYLKSISSSIQSLEQKQKITPLLIEIEPMDDECLSELEIKLGRSCARIKASEYNGEQFASLLSLLSLLISSRYHAHVLSIPHQVPCVAVSKDQRLEILFSENGLSGYCLSTHDSNLEEKLKCVVGEVWKKRSEIKSSLKESYHRHLREHKNMGDTVMNLMDEFISTR